MCDSMTLSNTHQGNDVQIHGCTITTLVLHVNILRNQPITTTALRDSYLLEIPQEKLSEQPWMKEVTLIQVSAGSHKRRCYPFAKTKGREMPGAAWRVTNKKTKLFPKLWKHFNTAYLDHIQVRP